MRYIKNKLSQYLKSNDIYTLKLNENENFSGINIKIVVFFYALTVLVYYLMDIKPVMYGCLINLFVFIIVSSDKFNHHERVITVSFMSNLLYCLVDLCYGKQYDFLIYLFFTNVFVLIFMRYIKLASFFVIGFVIISVLKTKFDYFGFDISYTLNRSEHYDTWRHVVFVTVCIYLFLFALILSKRIDLVIKNFITNHKELLESKIREKQLEKNRETFFATISHEIRTPLNAIKGILDLLKSHNHQKENDPGLFEIMNNASNHLLSLVNNFLDFTKLNQGKFTLNYGDFDLEENLRFVFKMNENLANEKKLAYKLTKIEDNVPKNFYADKNRINQIVLNILNNAVKYTKQGSVEMQYSCKKNEKDPFFYNLNIKIIDTGIGIPKDALDAIFETYANINSKNENSVGLGLSISKGLVELMNGSITVESQLGKGTVFTINIPLKLLAEKNEVSANTVLVNSIIVKKLKILVVDDNKINLMIISKQLQISIANPEIHLANDGTEAIEKLKTNNYDLILMDLMMPKLGGIEATKIIRNSSDEITRNTPIIALSANVEDNSIKECLKSGMNDYLSKPFDIKDLLQKINAITSSKE